MIPILFVIFATVAFLFLVPPALVLVSPRVSIRSMPLWVLSAFFFSWMGYFVFLVTMRAR